MDGFIQLFSEYDVPAAFLVNIELTLWSALFSLILGVEPLPEGETVRPEKTRRTE